MAPSPDELAALADKYETLARLRARRDAGGPEASRDELRELARRFPGSLRELDTLGPAELARRARTARAAESGRASPEPWMGWIAAFHRLMTAALIIKGQSAVRRDRDGAVQVVIEDRLALRAEKQAGVPLSRALLKTFASPPAGRLAPLVIGEVARLFGVPAEAICSCLFPDRRPPSLTSASRSW